MKLSVLVLTLCTLLMTPWGAARAADTGDEYIVPVYEWKCWLCNKQVFTFQPDNIDGSAKLEHKDPNYQQNNWMLLGDPSRSIPKCPKAKDGAHFFELIRERNTSPYIIMMRRNDYIVLKNGGSIKAKLMKGRCVFSGCGRTYWFFAGEDHDLYGEYILQSNRIERFFMNSGAKVPLCSAKISVGNQRYQMPHLFDYIGYQQPTSMGLAKNLRYVICSD